MDSSPEEIFYEANLQVDDEGDSGKDANQNQMDSKRVYFELEKRISDGDNDDISREDKYKTANSDLKNFDFKEKSKVDVRGRTKLFEAKGAKDEIPPSSDNHHGRPPFRNAHNNPALDFKVGTNNLADRRPESVYDKLWEGQSEVEDQAGVEYSTAVQISSQESSVPSSISSPSTESSNQDLNEQEHKSIYCLASSIPSPVESKSSPKNKKEAESKSVFYLPNPESTVSQSPSLENLKSSGNKGCQQGAGAAVPVDFVHPVRDSKGKEESEYTRLYFKSTASGSAERPITSSMRDRLRERGYSTLSSIKSGSSRKSSRTGMSLNDSDASEDDDDISFDWGSEFDDFSYQESIDDLFEGEGHDIAQEDEESGLPDKPLPPKPGKMKFGYQDFLPKPLRPTNHTGQLEHVDLSSSAVCLPVNINFSKHPPPCLPSPPEGLTDEQKKRRCVIDLIISSEKSYLDSLERILKQYEKAILEAIPHAKARVRVVFSVTREIISHHRMFQIELSEAVSAWDQEEKIGDIFTASFSKTMVVNAYSIYVNNFSAAMEEIRTAQRNKQSFDEFLRGREKSNADRLSIFGLMVKPVQRFPQFIMCLQDLIKYFPCNHHDRRALQLALTELENVTHSLNERKRCSEQRFQALQTIHQLIRQKPKHMLTGWNLDLNASRRLIRYDPIEQVCGEFEHMKCKNRRLILMNDLVLCVKVIEKEQSGFRVERLGLRWMAKLKDLELKDTAITPDMQSVVKKEPGKIHIISSQLDRQGGEKSEEDPFHLYADLSEMLHDFTVLGQMSGLVSTLQRSYVGYGLTEELVHEISRDLQRMIQIKDEQLRLVNSCSLVLVDNSRSDKPHHVIQTQTASIKQDWSVDFLMAKLAQDKNNSPAWDRTHASDDLEFDAMPAHFMKHLPVDVPRNYTKTKCAVSVFLTPEKSPSGLGVQHLWVCSSNEAKGQVSILSIHNSKPALTESFRASDCEIVSVELVPGCGVITDTNHHLFTEDTVWMSTANKEIRVFPTSSSSGVRRDPLTSIQTSAIIVSLRFVDERVFCGFDNGSMMVYSRRFDGAWEIDNPSMLSFGSCPVRIHFVWEEDLWLSCGNNLFVVEIDSLENKFEQLLHADHETSIDHVTMAGKGIWVSFANSAFIKLFHMETLENLQEMSIGNFLQRIGAEKLWCLKPIPEDIQVTCLASSKGLLWIGTNLGVILTLTLPRLSDGVPLYRGRPSVSLHAHQGPVKFLIPLICASNTTELKRSSTLSSTLRSRPSKRNIERERLEMEDSERKRSSLIENIYSSPLEEELSSEEGEGSDKKQKYTEIPGSSQLSSQYGNSDGFNGTVTQDRDEADVKDEYSNERIYENLQEVLNSSTLQDGEPKRDEDDVRKSFDDDPVLLRDRGNQDVNQNRRGHNLSFRSELAQRIMVQSRRLSGSCSDLMNYEPLEVEMLYEDLLGDDDCRMERVPSTKGRRGSGIGAGMRHTLSNFRSGHLSKISSEKVRKSSHQNNSSTISQSAADLSKQDTKSKSKPPISPSTSSVSPKLDGAKRPVIPSRMPQLSNASDLKGPTRNGTMRGTVRKSGGSNAVIVLSGGDGYRDLNSSRNQGRSDDAGIMLWIYKF